MKPAGSWFPCLNTKSYAGVDPGISQRGVALFADIKTMN